jgi:Fic family protein
VGGVYRGAPAENIDYLINRLCEWLDGPQFVSPDHLVQFGLALVKAIIAHVYIAWIHPYGDGNGRTARLVEAQILSQSNVPLPAINLLSDFYNRTRSRYALELARTSQEGTLNEFIEYALEGFVDGLRQHIDVVREHQVAVAFTNYVHELAASWPQSAASKRRRDLVLALSPTIGTPRFKLTSLTEELAEAYSETTDKTLTRDINYLRNVKLIRRTPEGLLQNDAVIRAWLPPAMLAIDFES